MILLHEPAACIATQTHTPITLSLLACLESLRALSGFVGVMEGLRMAVYSQHRSSSDESWYEL